ncbi:hypothetical protein BBJ28_00023573 [Nothophytophthora sp. Chile5]|nr:hypothetical protein BBJ28_00023573 [Nothophytophthora sp. Chile5]
MKLRAVVLAVVCVSLLASGGAAVTEGMMILQRQLREGKAVASLFENKHQTPRKLETPREEPETSREDPEKRVKVEVAPARFRIRRLRSPEYVELEE